jgi:hypothetical protein
MVECNFVVPMCPKSDQNYGAMAVRRGRFWHGTVGKPPGSRRGAVNCLIIRRSGERPTYLCSFGYRFRDRASALLVIISIPELRLMPRHGSYLTSDLADRPTLRWLAFGHDELQLKLAK